MDNKKIWLSSPHMGKNEYKYVTEAFDLNWIAPVGPHLNDFEKNLLREENHITEKILRENYMVFKSPLLKEFTRFGGPFDVSRRLSSHPDVYPTWVSRPNTFSWFENTEGELSQRFHDMRLLNCREQSAQIFFLRMWYELRGHLEDFIQKRFVDQGLPVVPTIGVVAQLAEMDEVMKKAQVLHRDVKFPKKSLLKRARDSIVEICSPKSKRKKLEQPM